MLQERNMKMFYTLKDLDVIYVWEIKKKAEKGDSVMSTSTRLFQGRVVKDSDRKKGESLLASTPVVVLSAILGRTPSLDEYKHAVKGIELTRFSPPLQQMTSKPDHLLSY